MTQLTPKGDSLAALRLMNSYLYEIPNANYTELAEHAAIELSHDEWLDDSDHWIWDLALEIGDQA